MWRSNGWTFGLFFCHVFLPLFLYLSLNFYLFFLFFCTKCDSAAIAGQTVPRPSCVWLLWISTRPSTDADDKVNSRVTKTSGQECQERGKCRESHYVYRWMGTLTGRERERSLSVREHRHSTESLEESCDFNLKQICLWGGRGGLVKCFSALYFKA